MLNTIEIVKRILVNLVTSLPIIPSGIAASNTYSTTVSCILHAKQRVQRTKLCPFFFSSRRERRDGIFYQSNNMPFSENAVNCLRIAFNFALTETICKIWQ